MTTSNVEPCPNCGYCPHCGRSDKPPTIRVGASPWSLPYTYANVTVSHIAAGTNQTRVDADGVQYTLTQGALTHGGYS